MSDDIRLHEPLPEDVQKTLRAMYAAPREDGYWQGLESRIVARVRAEQQAVGDWWSVLGGWVRVGLVAAAAIISIVTALLMRANSTELHQRYEALVSPAPAESLVVPAGALSDHDDARGATLRDVISR